jgi:cleavage and polyadenylation specificity factor subunit 1
MVTPDSAAHVLRCRLTRFDGLAYNLPEGGSGGGLQCGLFVAGSRPLWLIAARGGVVPHPMYMEGAVAAITPFHNVNCPHVRTAA